MMGKAGNMVDQETQPFYQRIARALSGLRRGPTWRLSTWWPNDSKRAMQRSLLRILSLAHTERFELAPLVTNFAEEHRGRYRSRLRRFASRLSDGTALVDALEQTPDVLSDDDVLTLRFATQTGTLTSAYGQLLARNGAAPERTQTSIRQTILYTAIMTVCCGLVLAFLIFMIVPTFRQIGEELQLAPPLSFELFVWSTDLFINNLHLWVLAFVAFVVLLTSSASRRFFRRVVASRWVPSEAQTRSAELLRLLALSVEAGRPLPAALSTLARYHFDSSLRQKLLFARNEVEQGADVWSSLAEAKLLSPEESGALSQSSSVPTRVWAMRHLADWKRDRLDGRREATVSLMRPLVVMIFAAVLLLTALALLGYLFHLINALS